MSIAMQVYGLSHMIHRKMWADFLSEATQHRYGALFIAMPTLAIGLLVVAGHNVWVWDVPLITTLLGWAFLVRGTVYLLWPSAVRNAMPGSGKARGTLMGVGLAMAALGAVMTWDAWFAAV